MTIRSEKIEHILRDLAARFLEAESSRSSLITVTAVDMSKDGKYATIFFTVFPSDKEKTALEFAKRKLSDFREFVKNNSTLGRIPFFDFELDLGEKNRQRIDALSQQ